MFNIDKYFEKKFQELSRGKEAALEQERDRLKVAQGCDLGDSCVSG